MITCFDRGVQSCSLILFNKTKKTKLILFRDVQIFSFPKNFHSCRQQPGKHKRLCDGCVSLHVHAQLVCLLHALFGVSALKVRMTTQS